MYIVWIELLLYATVILNSYYRTFLERRSTNIIDMETRLRLHSRLYLFRGEIAVYRLGSSKLSLKIQTVQSNTNSTFWGCSRESCQAAASFHYIHPLIHFSREIF